VGFGPLFGGREFSGHEGRLADVLRSRMLLTCTSLFASKAIYSKVAFVYRRH
jgi:hypothetical protein